MFSLGYFLTTQVQESVCVFEIQKQHETFKKRKRKFTHVDRYTSTYLF